MTATPTRHPFLLAVTAIGLLSAMDAFIKSLVGRFPVVEVAFLRYLVGSLVMVALVAGLRPGWPRPDTIRANSLRAVLVVVTAVSFFYGLSVLPLAEALIVSFVSPIFTAFLAAAVLRERIDRRIAGALLAGFAGVLVLLLGGFPLSETGRAATGNAALLGTAAILLSAMTYAATNVLLRARAQRDHVLIIVLLQNIVPTAILAVPTAFVWVRPVGADVATVLVVGCLGVAGHLCLARAYAAAEATRLAPLEYTALIWAAGIGFAAFGEVPTLWSVAGTCLILAGAASVTRRRRRGGA